MHMWVREQESQRRGTTVWVLWPTKHAFLASRIEPFTSGAHCINLVHQPDHNFAGEPTKNSRTTLSRTGGMAPGRQLLRSSLLLVRLFSGRKAGTSACWSQQLWAQASCQTANRRESLPSTMQSIHSQTATDVGSRAY
jgi:hypothetical protein